MKLNYKYLISIFFISFCCASLANTVNNEPTTGAMSVNLKSGGHPMPRFVLGQHAEADWAAMLQAYGDAPYAELLSNRAMLTATFSHARQFVDDPVKVLEIWDRIIAAAEVQFGMAPGNSAPNNSPEHRYHFVGCRSGRDACGDGYMYAWNYRTAYIDDAIKDALNSNLVEAEGWGAWHELGHVIQHDDPMKAITMRLRTGRKIIGLI